MKNLYCFLAILAAVPFLSFADDVPYAMMGCDTPVLDYVEPKSKDCVITEIVQKDSVHGTLMLQDKRLIVDVSGKMDTISLIEDCGETLLRFMTVDPLADKSPATSPYSYCKGDPINLIDPTGLKPTEEEAARMVDYVYQDDVVKLSGGWVVSSIKDYNFKLINGFKSMLFERTLPDGNVEYALAFAGTDTITYIDWAIDFAESLFQELGVSSQYWKAIGLAKDITKKYDNEITFVGHSLGGGLSAASAFATNGQAITFNAAGVSPFTRYENKRASIDAYITTNDILDCIQRNLGLRANGNIILRNPKPKLNDGHKIKNFY